MKTNKATFLKLFIIAMVPLFLSGCLNDLFNDGQITYNTDDPQVEFFPTTASFTLGADSTIAYGIRAQLIGEQRSEPLTLNVVVVDSMTTAQEGTQYSLSESSVTIPADSSSATYPITVSGQGLSAGQTVTLSVRLQGAQGVEAAENLRTHTVTIQGGG